MSNWRTLWKKSRRYENHIDAHISFITCPAPYPTLILKGTRSASDIMFWERTTSLYFFSNNTKHDNCSHMTYFHTHRLVYWHFSAKPKVCKLQFKIAEVFPLPDITLLTSLQNLYLLAVALQISDDRNLKVIYWFCVSVSVKTKEIHVHYLVFQKWTF